MSGKDGPSIVKGLERVMREKWNCDALTDYGSGVTYKYGDIATRICFFHLLFESLGIKPGDKVAVCGKNSGNWAVSMLAVLTYRAVAVPLLPDYSKEQLKMLCEHCGAKFIIASHRLANLWPEGQCPMYMIDVEDLLAMKPSSLTDAVEEKAFAMYAARYPGGYKQKDVCYEAEKSDDLMILSYTSGSTGNPKGVMLPWRSLQSNMEFAAGAFPCEGGQRLLLILPMAHMYGYTLDFLHGVMKGAHLFVLTQVPAPKIVVKAFAEVRPAYLLCVPLVLEKIINNKVLPFLKEPNVQLMMKVPLVRRLIYWKIRKRLMEAFGGNIYQVMMGGAPLSKEIEKLLHKVRFPYTIGYGMTECGPMITYSDWKEHRLGSNMEVRVESSDPQRVPGEIVTKGTNTMTGYYKNAEATADTIDKDGWLHTGDLGVMDKDGFIYIRGRKKNMLLGSNGQNIYPEEAEDQVVTHSIFEECVVVQRQEKLVGLVYVTEETLQKAGKKREELDLEAICKEVNLHLPRYCQLSKMEQRTEEYYKSMADVSRKQVETSREMVRRAAIQVEEGKRPRSEQADAEAQLATDEHTLATDQGQYVLALLTLAHALNIPDTQDFRIVEDEQALAPADTCNQQLPQSIYNATADRWPAIISAQAGIHQSEYLLKVKKGDYYPQVNLFGSIGTVAYNVFNNDDIRLGSFWHQLDYNRGEIIGLQLTYPIFNRFNTRNKVRQASNDIINRKLALEDAKLKLRKDIETAYQNANVAKQKVLTSEKSCQATRISLEYEEIRYAEGHSSIFDLLQARQKNFKAQQDAVQAKYEYLIRQRILDFYK